MEESRMHITGGVREVSKCLLNKEADRALGHMTTH